MAKDPLPDFLGFRYGTRAERIKDLRDRSSSRPRNQRGRSRKRNDGFFPPLNLSSEQVQRNTEAKPSVWNNNSLFRNSGKSSSEKLLKFFEPNPRDENEDHFIIMPSEVVERETKKWERCLVAYVVGKRPHFPTLKSSLELQWRLKASFQMHSLPDGFFLFKFLENSDRARVLEDGPWCFYGRPLVIKEWKHGLVLEKDQFNTLPIWVRLPELDFRLWDAEAIGRITSVIGNPKFVDDPTANRERLKFARACVEITPLCDFPRSIHILIGLKWIVQQLHYEWRPHACRTCNTFDHDGDLCPKKSAPISGGDDNQDDWVQAGSRRNEGSPSIIDGTRPRKIAQANSNLNGVVVGTSLVCKASNVRDSNGPLFATNAFGVLQQEQAADPADETLKQGDLVNGEDSLSLEEDSLGKKGGTSEDENLKKVDAGKDSLEINLLDGAFYMARDVTVREPILVSIREVGPEDTDSEGEDVPLPDTEVGKSSAAEVSPYLVRETPKNIFSGKLLATPTRQSFDLSSVGESIDDSGSEFPPGFTPTKDEEEGVSPVPPENLRELSESVDTSIVGEVVAPLSTCADTNFLTHRNLRRSPRLKKKPSSLDTASPSGLKKGIIK